MKHSCGFLLSLSPLLHVSTSRLSAACGLAGSARWAFIALSLKAAVLGRLPATAMRRAPGRHREQRMG